MLVETLRTKFSKILIKIRPFSVKQMHSDAETEIPTQLQFVTSFAMQIEKAKPYFRKPPESNIAFIMPFLRLRLYTKRIIKVMLIKLSYHSGTENAVYAFNIFDLFLNV